MFLYQGLHVMVVIVRVGGWAWCAVPRLSGAIKGPPPQKVFKNPCMTRAKSRRVSEKIRPKIDARAFKSAAGVVRQKKAGEAAHSEVDGHISEA